MNKYIPVGTAHSVTLRLLFRPYGRKWQSWHHWCPLNWWCRFLSVVPRISTRWCHCCWHDRYMCYRPFQWWLWWGSRIVNLNGDNDILAKRCAWTTSPITGDHLSAILLFHYRPHLWRWRFHGNRRWLGGFGTVPALCQVNRVVLCDYAVAFLKTLARLFPFV